MGEIWKHFCQGQNLGNQGGQRRCWIISGFVWFSGLRFFVFFSSFISKKGFDLKKGVIGRNQVFVERVGLGKGFRVKKKTVWVINFVFYTSLKCKKKNLFGKSQVGAGQAMTRVFSKWVSRSVCMCGVILLLFCLV